MSRPAAIVDRDAQACPSDAGAYAPVVDKSKCEAKADCVEVCPYDVFEVRRIDDADFAALSFVGKLRSLAHGRKVAHTPNAASCHACGLCVKACPERAIRLEKRH